MRRLLILFVAACLPAQEKPEYTFGTTVVSTSGLQGRICPLKENTGKLPRLEGMKSVGTIYTNVLNIWPQRFDEGFPGITDRVEWFGIDYTGRFWIENPGHYRFSLLSDDGARLRLDDKELIDNDGTHVPVALSASAFLSRGIHTIQVYRGARACDQPSRRALADLQPGRLPAAQGPR
ncbi:MAG: PA14 domain-containing protein [Candidatus Methylomirabilaceae bacterium]